ncbi:hypothetical protein RvY_11119 [Ramazzottius varieornatus]|uniref:Threonine synthase-like 2 n=1 Tax=Ramazzottius varieornatus TaxID=947166 RepID=A0A1D1VF20_RAMVA|nr:hypothetical protein RvY_11119 [Ramazzottius varieornatus]
MDSQPSDSMWYRSTRASHDGNDPRPFSFEDVLLMGFAPDGGMFLPAQLPSLDKDTIGRWSRLSYPDLVVAISQLFISPTEIPHDHLSSLIHKALRTFQVPEVILKQQLSHDDKTIVLELFHGQTLAFKDLAMSCSAQLLQYFLARERHHLNIIVSTSGDTGAAAMVAAAGSPNMDVTVLYPIGRVTQIQELQMTTAAGRHANLHLFGIEGTSDDGDEIIKDLFADKGFVRKNNLSILNSVNWCRIMIQIAHHFYAYFQALKLVGMAEEQGVVVIVCPTGGGGNISAAVIARAMGLAIRLVACTNVNDFLCTMVEKGRLRTEGVAQHTLASAMDIQLPYNIERILYILADNNDKWKIADMMRRVERAEIVQLPPTLFAKVKEALACHRSTDDDIVGTMKRCWREEGYHVCPHTATALDYHYQYPLVSFSTSQAAVARVCVSTASPVKFSEALNAAGILIPSETAQVVAELLKAPQKVTTLKGLSVKDVVPIIKETVEKITNERSD